MVKEWLLYGWIYLDTEIAMAIKMIKNESCGRGEIGLFTPTIQICHMINL